MLNPMSSARGALTMISVVAAIAVGLMGATAHAQLLPPPADVLSLSATAQAQVTPDLAVMHMAVEKTGADTAQLANEVNQILAAAIRRAQATPGVSVNNSGYATSAQFNSKGGRIGWAVRAEITLKSKDFGELGKLAGQLTQSMMLTSSLYELSEPLRAEQEAKLIERALADFRRKADAAAKALGYRGFSIREVNLGGISGEHPRPLVAAMKTSVLSESAPVPMSAGSMTLQLQVNGSVQMSK